LPIPIIRLEQVVNCFTCKKDIAPGDERRWGKSFKCSFCAKQYDRDRMAARRAKDRAPDWMPSKITFHYQTECDGISHICTGCNERKFLSSYYNNLESPCGKDPRCSACRLKARRERREADPVYRAQADRKWALNKLGLTENTYDFLSSEQHDLCALCEEEETSLSSSGKVIAFAVDHDHSCCPPKGGCRKCIRGLLCKACNLILGRIETKPILVEKFGLAEYLQRRPLLKFEVLPLEMLKQDGEFDSKEGVARIYINHWPEGIPDWEAIERVLDQYRPASMIRKRRDTAP
jgi:recombination endonuclease VII